MKKHKIDPVTGFRIGVWEEIEPGVFVVNHTM